MNTAIAWPEVFLGAFDAISERMAQVLELSDCREHWIQAELSLYAWQQGHTDVWTGGNAGGRTKVDLYTEDLDMAAEVKCLGDVSFPKCLMGKGMAETRSVLREDGDGRLWFPQVDRGESVVWSVFADLRRLQRMEGVRNKFLILVIAKDYVAETQMGETLRRLRLSQEEWSLELKNATVRIWRIE
ncbi:hypothetical protein [Pseudomonas chlororaphis]|uniref:hypothetical protein n=1 Tax=Pseudomonas chlororaphis TaxID=587753 RepID=UPI0006A633DB|nr:hypothetical protein [Pseudomonas chlororaphis]AZD00012.1 hypothetical protein C4K27_0796 [Pseudomonas chlororaphis subsp. chlororaphis]MBM0282005.1 hypothetical protein [Pseudomonas chlororaphis]MDO1504398.1 hypothetical protein [Pseudomonas chlororaphis]ORM49442.1 hypothetical protein B6D51_08250 [Pseudomonas chlororaphis subsp. chlororaphis]TWR94457.1 hypothetical protein FJD36_15445 [Pseudomonas chlororaphis subsp. chlororaphis]